LVVQCPEAPETPPLPGNDVSAAATETSSVVVTDRIRVVLIEVRISGPEREAEQPMTLKSIERREVPIVPAEREPPGDLARRAEERLGEEMMDTVAAAGGEKVADQILPAQGPAAAAEVVDLKSDLHCIMLGQLDVPLAQYVPLPGIDRSLDTAEVAILVGGIVLGTLTANPALYYSPCFTFSAGSAAVRKRHRRVRVTVSDGAGGRGRGTPVPSEAAVTLPALWKPMTTTRPRGPA